MSLHYVTTFSLSLAAGLHAALHGAWKDSPSEGFKMWSFLREFPVACVIGVALCCVDSKPSPFLIFLTAYSFNRIVVEFYKLFVRTVPQDIYRIPTQIHWMGRVIVNPAVRLGLGLGFLGSIYGLMCCVRLVTADAPPARIGPVAGLIFGTAIAVGGGYKDGSVTSFDLVKFVRSPVNGLIGGAFVSAHSGQLPFVVLGAVASERMLSELIKVLNPRYVGGHFGSTEAAFPEWITRRRVLLVPYALTWVLVIVLWTAGGAR